MKTKSGRFNYLASKEGSPENKLDSDRIQYKQIISQLNKDHQPKDAKEIFAYENPPRRTYSPIGHVLQLRPDPADRQIRSIILNEAIVPKISQQVKQSKRQPYRIIKDAHLISDQELDTFCQQNDSPPKVYYSPFKQARITPDKQPLAALKFYQIRNDPGPQDKRRMNLQKNNQPYINQVATQTHPPPQIDNYHPNPQNKRTTPTKISQVSESRIAKSNKAYKMEKSQQRIYRQKQPLPRTDYPYPRTKKRSCFDYVPEQMKARLKERQYGS